MLRRGEYEHYALQKIVLCFSLPFAVYTVVDDIFSIIVALRQKFAAVDDNRSVYI